MKPTNLIRALQALYETRQPIFVHGPPGVGKSALFRQAADSLDIDFLDIRGLLHDPSDLKFPLVDHANQTVRWVNSLFPKFPEWRGIIVLEELPLCPALMQGAFLQVTWDRRIGEYELPAGAWVVATGNRQEDRAGVNRMITPLLNRFVHFDLEVSYEDWQAWAIVAEIAPEVRSYLNYRPAQLHSFNPALNERAFPSPRSWDMLSRMLRHTPDDLLHPVATGAVGNGAGAEFLGFLRIYRELPDLDLIMSNPMTAGVPKEPAVLYALSGALCERFRKGSKGDKTAFVKYVGRLPDEFSVLTFRDAAALDQAIFLMPEAAQWLKTHRHLLLSK